MFKSDTGIFFGLLIISIMKSMTVVEITVKPVIAGEVRSKDFKKKQRKFKIFVK
jgi:hypothetical protein